MPACTSGSMRGWLVPARKGNAWGDRVACARGGWPPATGLSQAEAADRFALSTETIKRWRRGRAKGRNSFSDLA
jgi:hypothetical protein